MRTSLYNNYRNEIRMLVLLVAAVTHRSSRNSKVQRQDWLDDGIFCNTSSTRGPNILMYFSLVSFSAASFFSPSSTFFSEDSDSFFSTTSFSFSPNFFSDNFTILSVTVVEHDLSTKFSSIFNFST